MLDFGFTTCHNIIMISVRKLVVLFLTLLVLFTSIGIADAYVSVRGYWRWTKSGVTWVRPHIRSVPNAFKFDNYSWRPSQGLYNKSYYAPTRHYSSKWYTPAYISDPNYYIGK